MPVPKKNQLVGLDIGSHSIKLVEINDGKRGKELKSFGIIGLPKDTIVEGTVREMEIVASAIKNLFKNLNIKNKNICTSISGFSVIVKKITINKKDESELEAGIQEEAEQYIPFDISDVNLDYEILYEAGGDSETPEGENREQEKEDDGLMDVMLVAAKKDIIEDYVSLIHLAGLNPAIMDVDAFSLQNTFEITSGEETDCYAIVSIGAEELGINAVKNGVSVFTRDSSFGGAQITEAIMSKLNLSYEDAEQLKLGGTEIEEEMTVLEEIFTSTVADWVLEIKRALDFLATTYPDDRIEKIYITGGSSRLPGFKKYLENETEIPVLELNPFANLHVNDKVFDPQYLSYMAPQAGVAVGLALRSIDDK